MSGNGGSAGAAPDRGDASPRNAADASGICPPAHLVPATFPGQLERHRERPDMSAAADAAREIALEVLRKKAAGDAAGEV